MEGHMLLPLIHFPSLISANTGPLMLKCMEDVRNVYDTWFTEFFPANVFLATTKPHLHGLFQILTKARNQVRDCHKKFVDESQVVAKSPNQQDIEAAFLANATANFASVVLELERELAIWFAGHGEDGKGVRLKKWVALYVMWKPVEGVALMNRWGLVVRVE
jgi:hypothetical protein